MNERLTKSADPISSSDIRCLGAAPCDVCACFLEACVLSKVLQLQFQIAQSARCALASSVLMFRNGAILQFGRVSSALRLLVLFFEFWILSLAACKVFCALAGLLTGFERHRYSTWGCKIIALLIQIH